VQIDTLFVNVWPDEPIMHFTAYDPVAKCTSGRVCTEAGAISAKSSRDKLLREAPFRLRGIQVDGGAEFKSVFEAKCKARGSDSSPAMRPDLNGCVGRAQATWRYEIYAIYDLPDRIEKLQAFVDAFAHKFNRHTPRLLDAPRGVSPSSRQRDRATLASVSYVLSSDSRLKGRHA
jgi:putative transposase